ncbi:hypothetical protein EMIT0111MI5_160010 [Burkholderia sp. IT-111MI5]
MEPARIGTRVAVKTGGRAADGALGPMIVRATFLRAAGRVRQQAGKHRRGARLAGSRADSIKLAAACFSCLTNSTHDRTDDRFPADLEPQEMAMARTARRRRAREGRRGRA